MTGAVFAAQEMLREHPDYFMPSSSRTPPIPEAHRRTTALEILEATDERVDALRRRRRHRRHRAPGWARCSRSALPGGSRDRASSRRARRCSRAAGAARTASRASAHPSCRAVLNRAVLDEVILVRDEDATATARRLAREEGLLVGISAGANVWAACQVARERCRPDQVVVTVLCDTGERYLSVPLSERGAGP